jgi:glutamine synthetase
VAVLLCAVHEVSGEPHPSDPRLILKRVLGEASDEGYHLEVGSELEFFLVTRETASGISPTDRGGYFDVLPSDGGLDFRRRVVRTLRKMGIATTAHHHEAAEGQHEICLRHGPAVQIPDSVMLAKLAIAELAHQEGMIATFMPKPFVGCNGSGMHLHQSLWDIDVDKNLFATEDAGALSDMAGHYVAGLLAHAGALAAIVAPTINSYKRLTPGFEAPTRIAWGPRNRSTMIRVPQFNGSSMKARIEFRCPDPSCNPHLAIEPPSPTDEDLFESETDVASLPGSLIHAVGELNKDSTLRRALGDRVVDTIVDVRTKEWSEYLDATGDPGPSHITGWEMERYLLAS